MIKKMPDKYCGMVKKALIAAAAAGPLGVLPDGVLDAAAICSTWGVLLVAMLDKSGIKLDKNVAAKMCTSVIAGAAGYYAGCKVASKIFNFIPLAGPLLGASVSTLANVIFTYQFAWTVACLLNEDKITKENVLDIAFEISKRMLAGGFSVSTAKDIIRIYSY